MVDTLTVRLPWAGMLTDDGETVPDVANFWVVKLKCTGPLKPDVGAITKYADHVPAIGKFTSTWPKFPLP